ncbi:hypothetical protein K525DRAFT_204630 [Schizophyllum commune Loenen D]|nr:hypothetical protein K525DRAFT_204630 [Schizophyllum commune Loenen D]
MSSDTSLDDLPSPLAKLTHVLMDMRETLDRDKTPKSLNKKTHPLTKKALALLRTNPLKMLFEHPPSNEPYTMFLLRDRAGDVVSALYPFGILAELVNRGVSSLWVLDKPEVVWAGVFRWAEYLLVDAVNLPAELTTFDMRYTLNNAIDAVHAALVQLPSLPMEQARAILLSSEYDAVRLIVVIWLEWPAFLPRIAVKDHKPSIIPCISLLHALWPVIGKDNDARSVFLAQLLGARKGSSRRLFRTIASHLEAFANAEEYRLHLDFIPFIRLASELARIPELRHEGFPSKLVSVAVSTVKFALDKYPSAATTACWLLSCLCYCNDRAIAVAIKHGSFALLVQTRNQYPQLDSSKDYALMRHALARPTVVKHFHDSLEALDDGLQLSLDEERTVKLARHRYELWEEAEIEWDEDAVCGNDSCEAGEDAPLRAKDIAPAVRSSRGSASHSVSSTGCICCEYPSDVVIASLPPREVHFLAIIGRDWLENNYARLAQEHGESLDLKLDVSEGELCRLAEPLSPQPGMGLHIVMMDVAYFRRRALIYRSFMFLAAPRRECSPFKTLTQVVFSTDPDGEDNEDEEDEDEDGDDDASDEDDENTSRMGATKTKRAV